MHTTTSPEFAPADNTPLRRESLSPETQTPAGRAAAVAATTLAGLFAGFFLTYAMSVTVGLARVSDVAYVETFQAINATIRNAAFAVVFFGAAPAGVVATLLHRRQRSWRLFALGTALAIITMVITFAFSVPLNNELAQYVQLDAATAAEARGDFEGPWNRWNLIRTVTAVGAAISCCAASVRGSRRSTTG